MKIRKIPRDPNHVWGNVNLESDAILDDELGRSIFIFPEAPSNKGTYPGKVVTKPIVTRNIKRNYKT